MKEEGKEEGKEEILQGMKKDSPLYRTLSISGQEKARKAAIYLQLLLDKGWSQGAGVLESPPAANTENG